MGLITAEVFVSASYSITFAGASFYVRVTVDLSGLKKVSKIAPVIINFCSAILNCKPI